LLRNNRSNEGKYIIGKANEFRGPGSGQKPIQWGAEHPLEAFFSGDAIHSFFAYFAGMRAPGAAKGRT
jgi:hypothetical protein